MMQHFAYPNAQTGKFIGCGKFCVLSETHADYDVANPYISNSAEITTAARSLAPECLDHNELEVYQQKYDPEKMFGDSQGLAFLLALIHRSRELKFTALGDIWCTGSVSSEADKAPVLKQVEQGGFDTKFDAFWSNDKRDMLFILPAVNILPTHRDRLKKRSLRLVSLTEFELLSEEELSSAKTILAVHWGELELLVKILFGKIRKPLSSPAPIPPNPYRGLFAFREEDAELFFGRETYIPELAEHVRQRSFNAVIGASGSGKSSLVYAGLIPHLRRDETWNICAFRPGDSPLLELSSALFPFLEAEKSEFDAFEEKKRLADTLQSGDWRLLDVLNRICEKSGNARLLLFADQFEELYTLCHDEQERRRFLDQLLHACGSSRVLPFSCVLTMRADFMNKGVFEK